MTIFRCEAEMHIHWQFDAHVSSITLFPAGMRKIECRVLNFFGNNSGYPVAALVGGARPSLGIYESKQARDIASNLMEKGQDLLSAVQSKSDFGFLWFNCDPNGGHEHELHFVIELNAGEFDKLRSTIEGGLRSDWLLRFKGGSWFSDSKPNPHSKSPTWEQFELGTLVEIDDLTISMIFLDESMK
jgi:hypothetical protein